MWLLRAADDPASAARRFLRAAWACDDAGAEAQARICRDRAAEMLERAIASGDHEPPREVLLCVLADLRRRAGRFDEALAACEEAEVALVDAEGTLTGAVVAFIRQLAESGDDECHSAAEAFVEEE